MGKNYTVYMHITPSGKRYVGITGQKPYKRWLSGKGYYNNDYFYKAIKKYGWDNIEHKILFTGLTEQEAIDKEIQLIAYYDTTNRSKGYNIASGGLNTHPTEESIKKMSDAKKGKNFSEAHKKSLSEAKKGKRWTSKRIEASIRSKKYGAENKHSKPVLMLDKNTGEVLGEFCNAREAQDKTGISYKHISCVCNSKRQTTGGYKWMFKSDTPIIYLDGTKKEATARL